MKCSVCGRTVAGVFTRGRWHVGPHNRPTSHIPCEGALAFGHKRAQPKGKR